MMKAHPSLGGTVQIDPGPVLLLLLVTNPEFILGVILLVGSADERVSVQVAYWLKVFGAVFVTASISNFLRRLVGVRHILDWNEGTVRIHKSGQTTELPFTDIACAWGESSAWERCLQLGTLHIKFKDGSQRSFEHVAHPVRWASQLQSVLETSSTAANGAHTGSFQMNPRRKRPNETPTTV